MVAVVADALALVAKWDSVHAKCVAMDRRGVEDGCSCCCCWNSWEYYCCGEVVAVSVVVVARVEVDPRLLLLLL